jgi:toxin ParE1/3/4
VIVKWLRTALHNLDEEISYISREDEESAFKIYQYILERVNSLQNTPNIGRPGRVFGTRELVLDHYPYIIPYRVSREFIEILRVFHTSRKQPKTW